MALLWRSTARYTAVALFHSLALAGVLPALANAQTGRFEASWSEAEDRTCSATRGYAIKEAWTMELQQRLPEFQAEWASQGARMIAAAELLTHRPVRDFVLPVHLTLCDTPSQSFKGPTVNMRFALRSFTSNPVPLRYKLDTAFHESLHPFIARYAPRKSAMLQAHRAEPRCVLNHLHLLALTKPATLTSVTWRSSHRSSTAAERWPLDLPVVGGNSWPPRSIARRAAATADRNM